jgi:hypothetical protein
LRYELAIAQTEKGPASQNPDAMESGKKLGAGEKGANMVWAFLGGGDH